MSARAGLEGTQNVIFQLGSESYGIAISLVNEIIPWQDAMPMPRTESHVIGLFNLRGRTIPVLDITSKLGLGETNITDNSRIVVLDMPTGKIGVIVDAVREVVTVDESQIDPIPVTSVGRSVDCVNGVAKIPEGLITLLDLNKLLAA